MSSVAVQTRYTAQEYLAMEREAETKSECVNGWIYAMTGASREHNLIAGNLFAALHVQLRDLPCEIYPSDMRVRVTATGLYTYPDVTVVCGEPRFEDDHVDTLLNPTLLVEVLSPSTEAYDRGDKFAHYRRLDSLQAYVLVTQDRMRLEHYARQGDQWLLTEYDDPEGIVALPPLECEIPLREIYARIQLPNGDRPGHA